MFIAGRGVFSGPDAPVSQLSLCILQFFPSHITSTVTFGHATTSTHRRRKRNHGREKILCEVLMENLKDK